LTNNAKAQSVVVTDNKTGENKEFIFVRKAVKFIGIHYSYITKIIKTHRKSIYYNKKRM